METLNIYMLEKSESVDIRYIIEIKDGMALIRQLPDGRWHKIDCDCSDYELIEEDKKTDIPESHIICNVCNKVTYIKDLRP